MSLLQRLQWLYNQHFPSETCHTFGSTCIGLQKKNAVFNYTRKIWVLGSKRKVTTSSVCLKILIPKITYQHIICPNVFQHIIPKYSKYLITKLLRPQLRKQTGRWCIGWMGLGSSGCNLWWTCGRDVSICFVWGGTGKETHLVGVCGFSMILVDV
jgi:hypothetical protein